MDEEKYWYKIQPRNLFIPVVLLTLPILAFTYSLFTIYKTQILIVDIILALCLVALLAQHKVTYLYKDRGQVEFPFFKAIYNRDYAVSFNDVQRVEIGVRMLKGPYTVKFYTKQQHLWVPYYSNEFVTKQIIPFLEMKKIKYKVVNPA